jgi:ribosomal 50S subunit-recycling heat shock protein
MLIRVLVVAQSAMESGVIGLHGDGACESGEVAVGDSLAASTSSAGVIWEP